VDILMSVASHLRIRVAEYDRKIQTFIPYYREMLSVAAGALQPRLTSPLIVDLGTGTGALAKLCLEAVPAGRLTGLDTDSEMLAVAAQRLRVTQRPSVELKKKSFTRGTLPRANYITAAFSLHHIKTRGLKVRLYQRCIEALHAGGALVSVDCMPPSQPDLHESAMQAWIRHLEGHYSSRDANGHLSAWAKEDRYFPLDQEVEMLRSVGFKVEIVWRRESFAVIRATKPRHP
jgi:trans-aconitate methyltransferase